MNYYTYIPALSSKIGIEGYSLNWTKYVLLSSNILSNMQPLTCLRTDNSEVSGTFYNNYTIINENKLEILLNSLPGPGVYDVVACNIAGFTKLSDTNSLIVYN